MRFCHFVTEYLENEGYRNMGAKKKLNEGTSNFWSMDEFPLLIFADYETEDDKAREYAIGEMSEEEIEDMEDNYDFQYDCPRFAELVDEYYAKYADYCILDESEVDMLKDDLDSFNDSMRRKYWYQSDWDADGAKAVDGEDWEEYGVYPSVEIKPGYYEAAQLWVNVEPKGDMIQNYKFFMQEQIDEVNAFLKEMQKKYGLTEMGVSYRASNGETGYHKVESIKHISSIARILKESPMSDEDRKYSKILNSIVSKAGKNLSREEQDVLDKYGVDYSDGLGSFKGREYPHKLSWLPGDYSNGKPVVNDKVNVADKVRKDMSGERDYAKDVWAKGNWGDSFDKQERDYVNNNMSKDYNAMQAAVDVRNQSADNIRNLQKKIRGFAKDYNNANNRADKYAAQIELSDAQDRLGRASKTHKTAVGVVKNLLDKHRLVPECLKNYKKKDTLTESQIREGVMVHDKYFNDDMVNEFLDNIGLDEIGMMALKWMSQDDLIEMLCANEYWIDEYFSDEEMDESLKTKKTTRKTNKK